MERPVLCASVGPNGALWHPGWGATPPCWQLRHTHGVRCLASFSCSFLFRSVMMPVLDLFRKSADLFVVMFVCCCIGIKPPYLRDCGMLWLLFLFFTLPTIDATCQVCFGGGVGCPDTGAANCPWTTGVAANVAAVAAAAGAAIKLDSILPARYLRLFTRSVLQTLAIIAAKPKGGATFSFTGKTYAEIHQAVVGGLVTKDEGVDELVRRLNVEEAKTTPDATVVKQLERGVALCQKAVVRVASADVTDGTFLFILAKLSTVVCGNAGTFDLCVECTDDAETPSTSGAKRFSASLRRPSTMEQMYSLVHQFQLVCVTAGLATVMTMGPFLEEVLYEPLRLGVLEWPVAFELMILYLRMIENEPSRWNIANVVSASGGMDAKRAEASGMAKGLYSAAFFRRPRGEPRDDKHKPGDKPGNEPFKGVLKGHNETGSKGCASWNNGTDHLAKHVDASSGKCKFRHACNQYVTDKGPGGQCLGDHRRKDGCDYDDTKKCSQPQK